MAEEVTMDCLGGREGRIRPPRMAPVAQRTDGEVL